MLEPIQKLSGKSYGGVACDFVEIVEATGIDVWPDFHNLVLKTMPDLKTDYFWTEHHFRKGTLQFTEDPNSESGQVYTPVLKGIVSRDDHSKIVKLRRLSRIGLIVRWTDKNGNQKIMGSPDSPARLKYNRDNKDNRLQANEMLVTISCTARNPVLGCDF